VSPGSLLYVYDPAWQVEGFQCLIGSLKTGARDKNLKGNVGDDGPSPPTTTSSKNLDDETKQKLKVASVQLKK